MKVLAFARGSDRVIRTRMKTIPMLFQVTNYVYSSVV